MVNSALANPFGFISNWNLQVPSQTIDKWFIYHSTPRGLAFYDCRGSRDLQLSPQALKVQARLLPGPLKWSLQKEKLLSINHARPCTNARLCEMNTHFPPSSSTAALTVERSVSWNLNGSLRKVAGYRQKQIGNKSFARNGGFKKKKRKLMGGEIQSAPRKRCIKVIQDKAAAVRMTEIVLKYPFFPTSWYQAAADFFSMHQREELRLIAPILSSVTM